jgi:hypothetical protein
MTRNYRRERGSETQHTAADWFRSHGWPACEATGAGRQGRDLTGLPGLDIEVKGRRDLNLTGWLRQAVTRAGSNLPAVLHRPDGYGPAKIADWPVTVRLADFTTLLTAAGYNGRRPGPPDGPSGPCGHCDGTGYCARIGCTECLAWRAATETSECGVCGGTAITRRKK